MAGTSSGNALLMKLFLGLAAAFIVGGIVLYGVVSAHAGAIAGNTDRMNRMENRSVEFQRGIKTDLGEIRGLLIQMGREKVKK